MKPKFVKFIAEVDRNKPVFINPEHVEAVLPHADATQLVLHSGVVTVLGKPEDVARQLLEPYGDPMRAGTAPSRRMTDPPANWSLQQEGGNEKV